jgi:hypothetical protein
MDSEAEQVKKNHYMIGKSFGLTSKESDISDYKEKLDDLKELFKKNSKENLVEISKYIENFKAELFKNHKLILNNQQQFSDQIINLITRINKLLSQGLEKNPVIQKNAEELFLLGFENLKKSNQLLFKEEKEILNIINTMNEKCEKYLIKSQELNDSYLDDLSKKFIDFSDFEEGLLMGKALKISMSDKE